MVVRSHGDLRGRNPNQEALRSRQWQTLGIAWPEYLAVICLGLGSEHEPLEGEAGDKPPFPQGHLEGR